MCLRPVDGAMPAKRFDVTRELAFFLRQLWDQIVKALKVPKPPVFVLLDRHAGARERGMSVSPPSDDHERGLCGSACVLSLARMSPGPSSRYSGQRFVVQS
jgi:hypothetical protein